MDIIITAIFVLIFENTVILTTASSIKPAQGSYHLYCNLWVWSLDAWFPLFRSNFRFRIFRSNPSFLWMVLWNHSLLVWYSVFWFPCYLQKFLVDCFFDFRIPVFFRRSSNESFVFLRIFDFESFVRIFRMVVWYSSFWFPCCRNSLLRLLIW